LRLASHSPLKLAHVVRWSLAAVFLYAGAAKLQDPAAFAHQIDAYRLLPPDLVLLTAAVLPVLEILCGLLLLAGRWLLGASVLVTGLTLAFLFAMGSAIARGLNIDCGCFSVSGGHAVSGWRMLEDLLLLLAACYTFLSAARLHFRSASSG